MLLKKIILGLSLAVCICYFPLIASASQPPVTVDDLNKMSEEKKNQVEVANKSNSAESINNSNNVSSANLESVSSKKISWPITYVIGGGVVVVMLVAVLIWTKRRRQSIGS